MEKLLLELLEEIKRVGIDNIDKEQSKINLQKQIKQRTKIA